ncbi:hypothetical protein K2173_027926 [Erythroxylum novogranatense]|uniref:Carbohydrate kinase PfkB domain-containing protein n=1 Tax=Erythroxylum novogranatense TaxID=1862640 RepID=A0AAV8U3D8_9ROSI|nr:hypothetical protein K2173_027926 [Erythroxylum novogranatense]
MGAEALPIPSEIPAPPPHSPVILGLQPPALVDHVAPVDWSLLDQIPGDQGGSSPVTFQQLEEILSEVNNTSPLTTIAGGSVANTIRGLSAGFGLFCGLIGAYADDEQGRLFVGNMSRNGVNVSGLRLKEGHTAQCVCLVDQLGNRTMRPCLSSAVQVQADEITREDVKGSKWLVLRYGMFDLEVVQAAIRIAKQEHVLVSMDLASFEMVRDFGLPLLQLLESRDIDLCFANEDEARELMSGGKKTDARTAVEFLAQHCKWAVVTLGPNGCIAKHGKETVRVPAIRGAKAIDATGAGDLFASGFLYGLVAGLTLKECCEVGACCGASVIRSIGGEVTPENWKWAHKQMQIKIKGVPIPTSHN